MEKIIISVDFDDFRIIVNALEDGIKPKVEMQDNYSEMLERAYHLRGEKLKRIKSVLVERHGLNYQQVLSEPIDDIF